ncbi:hypothetical protein MKX01_015099, partial [Papaver californicum]
MSAKEIGNVRDNQPHEEMIEIKKLLQVLIQSQAKQAESQGKLERAQAQQAEKDNIKSNSAHLKEITKASGGVGKKKDGKLAKDKVVRAKYNPDRSDLLLKGDCEKTIEFLNNNPEALQHGVTRNSFTVLHVAIYRKREMKLINEIVKLMTPELLEYRAGEYNSTVLHLAAQYGNAEAVVLLVNNNPRLPLLLDKRGFTPLDIAIGNVTIDQKEVVEYLYSVTQDADPSPFSGGNGAYTLCRLIEANFYDIALCLVMKFPKMATSKSNSYDMCGLEMMVRRPFAFQSGAKLTWWQKLIYSLIQVDTNSTCIQPVKPAGCIVRDEENPLPENLDCTNAEESSKVSSSTSYGGTIMTYLTR